MARNYFRYMAAFLCQGSAAIVADVISTGAITAFDTQALGNCDGCDDAVIEIDVTVAPATATRCQILMQPLQHDEAGNAEGKDMGSIPIGTAAKKYSYEITGLTEQGNIVIKAIDYNFTASASMKGKYPADA